MALIDLSRQTNLDIGVDSTLVVSGIIDIVNSGLLNILQGAITIDGEPIDVSADELNFLQGASENIQSQISGLSLNLTNLEDTSWNISTAGTLSGGGSGTLKDGISLSLTGTSTTTPVDDWFANIKSVTAQRLNRRRAIAYNYNIHSSFHTGGTADNLNQWLVFVNGQLVEKEAINSIYNDGDDIIVYFNIQELGYPIRPNYEIVIWGPMITI